MLFSEKRSATSPPAKAPSVVKSSRTIPSRTSARPDFKYSCAAPVEVVMTESKLVPTATLTGSPKTKVRKGTTKTPPPNPR